MHGCTKPLQSTMLLVGVHLNSTLIPVSGARTQPMKLILTPKQCLLLSLMWILSGGITGCAVGPDFEEPPAPDVDSYTEHPIKKKTISVPGLEEGGSAQEFQVDAEIPEDWWTLFRSPELNALIERGIKNNPSLKMAEATLQESQENLMALVGSTMLPAVTGAFTDLRQQNPPFNVLSGVDPSGPLSGVFDNTQPPFSLYYATVNVSYTLDVFGGNRRAIEALAAQVDYQRYEFEAAYLTLTSNIVTTAITEASLREQIKATQDILDAEQKELDITQKQFKLGGVSKTSVLAQKTQLEQTRATLPVLEKNLAIARSSLAILVGDFPGNAGLPVFHLDNLHLPTQLPVSLPSSLVRQRPDVQAAEALLHASTAQIGVATANLLPNFTLTGSYGTETGTFSNLFGPGTRIWNWQGQVLQTFFNGGALFAQRRAAIDAFKAACAQYELAVLTAFKNVSDVLSALEFDAHTLHATQAAEAAAKETLDLVEQQYFLGGTNYLSLLYAQMQYHQAYISRIQAEATRYTDTAALFQAMGGGWWHRNDAEEILGSNWWYRDGEELTNHMKEEPE